MPLHFIVDDPSQLIGDIVVLTGAEAHHAAVVRRVVPGETVTIGDGRGAWHTGSCREVSPKRVVVEVQLRSEHEQTVPRITLVQALAKGDRDERAIQAATELGVSRIIPWQAARSVSRWDAAKEAKALQRWQSIVREAAKQAHRAWIPEVHAAVRTPELIRQRESADLIVLEPSAEIPLSALDFSQETELILIVGPEGGITAEELEQFAAAGADIVRLGESILRTSTAGPAALAALSVLLGRW